MSAIPNGVATRNFRGEPTEQIAWRVLQDERLSFRALGVLTYLLSLPDEWQTSAAKLAAKRKEGRDAIETALTELQGAGYLIRKRIQYSTGQWSWLWLYGPKPEELAELAAQHLREIAPALSKSWVRNNVATGPRPLDEDEEAVG